MRVGATLASLLLGVCWAGAAGAAGTNEPEPTTEVRLPSFVQLHFDAGLGVSTTGLSAAALGLLRVGPVEAGPACQSSFVLSSRTGCGALLGLGFDASRAVSVDVLAELGANYIHRAGDLFSDDPGASGSVGYAGARVGTRWRFGRDQVFRASIGLWLFVERDLSGYEVRYSYTDVGWLSGTSSEQTGARHLGDELELGGRAVVGFDIMPR